jgi:hypothetical protein
LIHPTKGPGRHAAVNVDTIVQDPSQRSADIRSHTSGQIAIVRDNLVMRARYLVIYVHADVLKS